MGTSHLNSTLFFCCLSILFFLFYHSTLSRAPTFSLNKEHPTLSSSLESGATPHGSPFTHIVSGTPVSCSNCVNFFGHVRLRLPPFFRGYGICGSSVIGRRAVMTAGHCTRYMITTALLKVSIGATDYGNGHEIRVSKMYVHPKWESKPYDIAVFLLEDDIPLEIYRPVQIAAPTRGAHAVYGLGFTRSTGFFLSRYSNVLNVAHVDVRDDRWCRRRGMPSHETCATGVGPCTTDSGGPLMNMPRNGIAFAEDETPTVMGVTVRVTAGGCDNPNIIHYYSRAVDYKGMLEEAARGDFSSWDEAHPSLPNPFAREDEIENRFYQYDARAVL